VRENGADIVCLSALLTVTMPAMKTTIEALREAGLRDKVRVLVGGAPVTQHFANEIGADGYGESATAAVALARSFMGAAA
jgi:5-methyltetrahydrofolate--homocysteine methyltransferase